MNSDKDVGFRFMPFIQLLAYDKVVSDLLAGNRNPKLECLFPGENCSFQAGALVGKCWLSTFFKAETNK